MYWTHWPLNQSWDTDEATVAFKGSAVTNERDISFKIFNIKHHQSQKVGHFLLTLPVVKLLNVMCAM